MADLCISCCAFPFIAHVCLPSVPFSHSFLVFLSPCAKTPPCLPDEWLIAWSAWYLIYDVAFVVVFYSALGCTNSWHSFCVESPVCWCYICSWFFEYVMWKPSFWVSSFTFCLVPFFLTCLAPFSIAHCGYWHIFSASGMCFSSTALSSGSVRMVVRSYEVLTTDSLCVVGCSDVHRRYWSVCGGFL